MFNLTFKRRHNPEENIKFTLKIFVYKQTNFSNAWNFICRRYFPWCIETFISFASSTGYQSH